MIKFGNVSDILFREVIQRRKMNLCNQKNSLGRWEFWKIVAVLSVDKTFEYSNFSTLIFFEILIWWFTAKNERGKDIIAWVYWYSFASPVKSHVCHSFGNVFKINVLKVIIHRKDSVSKINKLKGKIPKKSVSSRLNFSMYLEKLLKANQWNTT